MIARVLLIAALVSQFAHAERRHLKPKPRCTRSAYSSTYGHGDHQLGHQMANGHTYTTRTMGVAHKTIPLGTKITLCFGKRFARVRVLDRGPYVRGRIFDIQVRPQAILHFPDLGTVKWRYGWGS